MSRILEVKNIADTVTEGQLRDLFAPFGTVASAEVIRDFAAGLSEGYAYVEMSTDEEACAAANALNGKEHAGSRLSVIETQPPEGQVHERPTRPSARYRGSGGSHDW